MAVDRKRIYHKRDRLRQLRAFCQAAHLSSITQAVESLGVSQPSVSIQIRELENELDTVLFDRGGPGIALTRAGQRLFELAAPMVQGMDELPATLTQPSDSDTPDHIQLAASVIGAACVLPPYVRQFRDVYPKIRIQVTNCLLQEGLDLLLDNDVEFVIGPKEPHPADTLVYHQMLSYEIVLITSLDHPLAGRTTVSPQEAGDWPAIVPSAGTYSRQFGETAARQFGVDIKAVIEVGGWGVIKRYVACGLGISIVPSISIMDTDQVSVIPLRDYFPPRSFGVFTRRGKYLTPPALRFLRLMVPDFPEPLLRPPPTDRTAPAPA